MSQVKSMMCMMTFHAVPWEAVLAGQTIYFPNPCEWRYAQGPFQVLDPVHHLVRNASGIEVSLPEIVPHVIVMGETPGQEAA